MGIDLRLGRWQDVLADVETVDAVICDPPYSQRTAKGQRSNRPNLNGWLGSDGESHITYGFMTEEDCRELVASWIPRTAFWLVVFGDHLTVPWYLDEAKAHGWYTFAPVVWVKPNGTPRMQTDGPSHSVEWIAVARARRREMVSSRARYRPGHYIETARHGFLAGPVVVGGKPAGLMRRIVRDYSRPGDLVCDPCAGGGTTLRAALMEGRRAVGAEMDETTWRKAVGTIEVLDERGQAGFQFGESA